MSENSYLQHLFYVDITDALDVEPMKNAHKRHKKCPEPNPNPESTSFIISHLPYSCANFITNPIDWNNYEFKDDRNIQKWKISAADDDEDKDDV